PRGVGAHEPRRLEALPRRGHREREEREREQGVERECGAAAAQDASDAGHQKFTFAADCVTALPVAAFPARSVSAVELFHVICVGVDTPVLISVVDTDDVSLITTCDADCRIVAL